MITITLDQIRAKFPCEPGWRKILSAEHLHGGDFSAPFPLADTIDVVGISDTIWALRCIEGHDRLKRRFAAWCAHQSAHLNTDPRVMAAIVAAENLADNDTPENRAAADAARAAAYAADAAADAATDAARETQANKLRACLTAGEWLND